MDKILLASNNQHKIKEFNEILYGRFDLVSQSHLNIEEIEETGLSFVENAILKARNASKAANLPAIADDSGIEVDALSGRPGIYSARYAGLNCDDNKNNKLLLKELKNIHNPIIGFIGGMNEKINLKLMDKLIEKLPDYSFVFIALIYNFFKIRK